MGKTSLSYRFDYVFLFKVAVAAAVMAICVKLIPVSGALGLALVVVLGLILFAAGLLVLRAFSSDERQFIREVLNVRAKTQPPSQEESVRPAPPRRKPRDDSWIW